MGQLKVYQDQYTDATIVSNRFIDEYMAQANDAQLKIYLYLLRMLHAGQLSDISCIADAFNFTEKDVLRALKYWEKRGVLALEYDGERNLSGIRLLDLQTAAEPAGAAQTVQAASSGRAEVVALRSRQELSAADSYAKPSYSLDDLKAFRARESTAQLLFVTEQYLGRPLSASDVRTLLFFSDKLHFSDDLIDYLLQYCVERNKKDFRYIEKVAVSWAEAHVTTPKEAQRHASKYDRTVYEIMNALGKNNPPTRREADFIRRWREEYGLETDLIIEACERTVLATDRHRFEYADKILTAWKEAGVQNAADVARLDQGFQKERPAKQVPLRPAEKYNRFMQNSYDYEALEQELLHGRQ